MSKSRMRRGEVLCPECQTRLRFRSPKLAGVGISCPNCETKLVTGYDEAGQLSAQPRDESHKQSVGGSAGGWRRWVTPLSAAWTIAGLFLAVFLWVVFSPSDRDADGQRDRQDAASTESDSNMLKFQEAEENEPPQDGADEHEPSVPQTVESDEHGTDDAPKEPLEPEPVAAPREAVAERRREVPPPPPVPRGVPARLDIAGALGQPILLFDQSQPASLKETLVQLEELTGVPIRFADDELETEVTSQATDIRLKLEETTVGEIVKGVADQLGLEPHIRRDHIELRRRAEDSSLPPDAKETTWNWTTRSAIASTFRSGRS